MTLRTSQRAAFREPLTELENAIMRCVWDSGPCSVEAVHQSIGESRSLKEASTRTILRRLEQKGYLTHTEDGRAYVYRATEPARSLAGRAVRQIIDSLCRGSIEELVSGMVDAKVLSRRELEALEGWVRARKEAKR